MRVIITAGGTGGHIYPALAIINKIKMKEPQSEILYIGTHNRMEKDIIPERGINYKALKIIGLNRKNIFKNITTVKYLFKSIKEAKKIIKEFKPDLVIGVGGYVTVPVIYAAKKLGYKTLIHEQNSVLGLANRFLLKYSDVLAVSFESMTKSIKKAIYTGNPCSEEALHINPLYKRELNLSLNKKLVVIVMGSLGSKIINDKMKLMLQLFNNKEYEVIYITGKKYYAEFKDLKLASNIKIIDYHNKLLSLLKNCDLVVSRAGASTISEITALNIPSILIPSPHVTNNHQYKNALDLYERNAALILEEKDLNGDILVKKVDELLSDENKYNNIKKSLEKLVIKDSATRIYEIASSLIKGNK